MGKQKWTLKHETELQRLKLILDPDARDMSSERIARIARSRAENKMSKRDLKQTRFCRELWMWAQEKASPTDLEAIEWAIEGYIQDVIMGRKRDGIMGFVFGKRGTLEADDSLEGPE